MCNGCQLMCNLGLVGKYNFNNCTVLYEIFNYINLLLGKIDNYNSLNIDQPSVIMCHNKSGRYESRFSTVKINPSKAIMFKDMYESILGVWIAHAEGNFDLFIVL